MAYDFSRIPHFELLRQGVLRATDTPADSTPFGATGCDGLGLRFMTGEEWERWNLLSSAKLWQAVALQCFLDPSTGGLPDLQLTHFQQNDTAAGLFVERLEIARADAESGMLPCLMQFEDARQNIVALQEFAEWSRSVGVWVPYRFPQRIESPLRSVAKAAKHWVLKEPGV